MKKIIKDYLTFSKKERTAIILLLLLMACFIAVPYLYSPKATAPLVNKALIDFLAQSSNSRVDSDEEDIRSVDEPGKISAVHKKETFYFDPNMASQEEWKRLGVSEKNIRTIFNYKNKGGKFRSPEALRKIWGISEEDADRLIPFVKMQEPEPYNRNYTKPMPSATEPITHSIVNVIDVNTAGVEEWKALPGIGEVLATRITRFRDRIGGFTSLDQVRKTYGISDSVFRLINPYLKLNATNATRVNLNNVSAFELRVKAGIPEAVAKAIIVFRSQYGPYQSVDDLKKIVLMSDSLFMRVAPFLTAQ